MHRPRLCGNRAEVSDVRAAIDLCVRVERLAPASLRGQADPVFAPNDGREIADNRDRSVSLGAHAQECEHGLGVVVHDNPAETLGLAIARMQRGSIYFVIKCG